MDSEKPPSWLGPDGELLVEDSSIAIRRRPHLGAIVFVGLVLIGMLFLVGTAFYFQQGTNRPIPTLMPVTPGAEIPSEYFDARYGVQIRYDYSQTTEGSCVEQRVYGTVEGAEAFTVHAVSNDTILKAQAVQTERRFNLAISVQTAPVFDIWLVDVNGERVTGVRSINLGQVSGRIGTCTIEVTFYPVNQNGYLR